MGVGIEEYRLRIGLFGSGRGYIPRSNSPLNIGAEKWRYQNTDIAYRLFATFVVIGTILLFCHHSLRHRDTSLTDILTVCSGIDVENNMICNLLRSPYERGSISDMDVYITNYASIKTRLIMLSSDVEQNPGPLSASEQTLLDAIQASEQRVLGEIKEVKSEITCIKTEISEIKGECLRNKQEISGIKQSQKETDKHVKTLNQEIINMRGEKEVIQLDIDHLNEVFETKLVMLDELEDDVDKLEKETRKSTMRIFGLQEEPNENIKAVVTEKVLKLACPYEDWNPDDIQRAYRVGECVDDQPRITIMTFRYSDDKYRIYKGRDKLRENGIRVSDDLTKRQRIKMKDLKQKGYTGYFYKGKIHARQKKSTFKPGSKETPEQAVKRLGGLRMKVVL